MELELHGTKTLSIAFPTRHLAVLTVPTRATQTTKADVWNVPVARRIAATLEPFTIQVLAAAFPNKQSRGESFDRVNSNNNDGMIHLAVWKRARKKIKKQTR